MTFGPKFAANAPFETLKRVRTPRAARWSARALLFAFLAAPGVLLFVPWQQTVRGRGQIVAFSPTERKQAVVARVSGQIRKWHVVEGSRVKAGDAIVDIDDNDPDLSIRLDEQRKFLMSRKKAATEEVAEQTRAVTAQEQAQEAAVAAAQSRRDAANKIIEVAQQTKANAAFAVTFEDARFQMHERLLTNTEFGGLESRLNRDESKLRADRAATEVKKADAEIAKAQAEALNAGSLVQQAEATGLSLVALARRDLHKAEQNLFGVEREMQELDSRIARFEARLVKSPSDGTVFRIYTNVAEGGQYVKAGDSLALIVPDSDDRVIELFIDGVDAPLIAAHMQQLGTGPHVRVQFEGWPAVQFAGWPSVAIGTFGGRIRQIDPTDDGNGRFRVLVEPDRLLEGDEWPEAIYLRQGNQAIGWVFLNRVTLGFELWRQFNGFPPVIAPTPPKETDGRKPPKIKTG